MICGSSGIGKTEVARILTRNLSPDQPFIKINFGNYSDHNALSSLIGSPRGYIGSSKGELSEKLTNSRSKVILIDDGSVDSSFEICKKYCLEDSRFKVVWQKNSGIAAARNRGLEMCCGEYIGFIDSDDYLISDALEKIKNEIDKNKRTQCLFWNYIEFRDNRLLKICDIELEDCVDNPLYFEFIPHLPYAYKRKNNILYSLQIKSQG